MTTHVSHRYQEPLHFEDATIVFGCYSSALRVPYQYRATTTATFGVYSFLKDLSITTASTGLSAAASFVQYYYSTTSPVLLLHCCGFSRARYQRTISTVLLLQYHSIVVRLSQCHQYSTTLR
eukprot:6783421-Pyramimonas_sp.AAC.1